MGVTMRGDDTVCGSLFSYIDLEKRVRADHPLRLIREIANAALAALTGTFEPLYSPLGRSSIPPERLMRALLLQPFRGHCTICSKLHAKPVSAWSRGSDVSAPRWWRALSATRPRRAYDATLHRIP